MGLCVCSTVLFIITAWLCLAMSPPAMTQSALEECILVENQCAPPGSGWVSLVRAERPLGIDAFTAVDLSWEPIIMMGTRRDYVVAYRRLDGNNSDYMLSMPILNREDYRLTGLEHNTSYLITVCRPHINESFFAEISEDPQDLLLMECGFCSTCHTTNAAHIQIIEAEHDFELNADTEEFECQAFGEPIPVSINWTVIDPNTNERVQLVDGERGVTINETRLVDNDLLSLLEAPVDEDLLISGQINCIASNGVVSAVANTRQFIDEDDQTPTREPTTQDPTVAATGTMVPPWAIGLTASIVVLLVLGVVFLGLVVFWKRRQVKDIKKTHEVELSHHRHKSNDYYEAKKINNTPNELDDSLSLALAKDKIIPSSSIKLSKVIGQGEFGIVYKGTLTTGSMCELVAVKTLKGIFATDADVKTATDEILKMQSFNHPNVMTLIGVCVSGEVGGSGGPSIVMPYMSKGSLLDYLRKEGSNIKPTGEDDITQIGSVEKLLVQICLQVAKGMDYLAGLKFIHRDLAARNCMIGYNGNIKVADFGLAEDVYMKNYFRQSEGSSVKLPIKWMALESIKLGVFSEKSDVWSYGVTCWEVFTAGEIPYPGIHPREVIKLIEDGERMDKPKNAACTDHVYGLIASCWDSEPDDRPTFSEIVTSLESHLLSMADYLDLSIVTAESRSDSEAD